MSISPMASIDIVVPHFRDLQGVQSLVQSLLNNDRTRFGKLIIVDDQSGPNYVEPLQKMTAQHRSWLELVLLQQNSGPAKARNAGAARASADWIWFIDSDVSLHKNAFANLRKNIDSKSSTDIFVSGVGLEYLPSDTLFQRVKNYLENSWQPQPGPSVSVDSKSFTILKSRFFEIGGFDEGYKTPEVEDYDFAIKAHHAGLKIEFVADVRIYHRHPGFWKQARLFRERARGWMRLKRRQSSGFDDYGTTASQGAAQLSAAAFLFSAPLTLFDVRFCLLSAAAFLCWVGLNKKVLSHLFLKKESPFFILYFIVSTMALSLPVLWGATEGLVQNKDIK